MKYIHCVRLYALRTEYPCLDKHIKPHDAALQRCLFFSWRLNSARMCNIENYTFAWWRMPPFVDFSRREGENGSVSEVLGGLMPRSILNAVALCCKNSTSNADHSLQSFKQTVHDGQEQMLANVTHEFTVALPVIIPSTVAAMKPSEYFIRMVDSNGMVHVGKQGEPLTHVLIEAFLAVWPLLAALIVLTGYSAIILWLLHYKDTNRHEQLESLFDWYWFSFITAATVGYGDKIPKGITSKIFTMFWAVLGISVSVGTTATLTTLLTEHQQSVAKLRPVRGEKVAVLTGSIERRFVMLQGGIPEEFRTFNDMMDSLKEGKLEHLAIDHYSFHHHLHEPLPNGYRYEVLPTPEVTIGYILFAPDHRKFLECLRLRSFLAELSVDSELIRNIGHKLVDDSNDPSNVLQNAADAIFSNSLKFTLLLLTVLCVVLACIIAAVDCFGKLKKCKKQGRYSESKPSNVESPESDKLNNEVETRINIPPN